MFRQGTLSAVVALAATLFAGAAHAQTPNGRITGVVKTSTGAPVSSARITATGSTGSIRSGVTDADGRYAVNGLPAGAYTVSAARVGYRKAARTDVRVSGDATADFTLEPLPLNAITVTATLREQELADVPFSIAAPTAEELRAQGVTNIEELSVTQAGFTVQNLGPGQSQVAMRGTSAGQTARDQPGVKEEVGVYLDGVPVSLSLYTPDLDLFDVSRVEVLRGPQGTLFGAGSLAGTVRYISNQPELGVRNIFGEVGSSILTGGSAGANVKFGANVPLGDKTAGRFAAYYNRFGGYMDAVQPDFSKKENLNTSDRTGVRASVRFAPTARFSLTPRVVYQQAKADGWNRHDAFNILANQYTTSRTPVTLGQRELFTQIPEPYGDNFALGDLNATYDLGGVSLTSVTAYTNRDISVVRDGGALYSSIVGGSIGLPEPVYTMNAGLTDSTHARAFTQELRLSGEQGGRKWLVGGFFSHAQRDYGQSVKVPGFDAAARPFFGNPPPGWSAGLRAATDELFYSDLAYDMNQQSYFGEGTVPVGARVNLTAGLRYYAFDEDRTQVFDGIFGNDNNGTSLVSQPGSTKAHGYAPRFMASFKASQAVTLNAQASKGFRLGGINDPLNVPICTAADLATFQGHDGWKDETAWNYEVGAKSTLLNGRVSANVSAYYMDIQDLQLTVTAGSCTSRLVFNVPKAHSSGLEFEFNASANEHLDLSLNASLNNGELGSTLTSNGVQISGIKTGNRLPSVPRAQGAASATYGWQVRSASRAFVTGSYRYVGDHYTLIDDLALRNPTTGVATVDMNSFAPNTIGGPLSSNTFTYNPLLPAYSLANVRVGVSHGIWETALFVNNLTNEEAYLALDRERGTLARVGYLTNPPRTIGVMLRFNQ